jgi:hypothetical protein
VAGAIAVGAVAAAVAAALGSPRLRSLPRPALLAGAAVALLLALGAGWLEQRRYLRHRYEQPAFAAPGLNAAFAWARDLSDKPIGTTATREYPLFGNDLSNRVQYIGVHRPHAGFVRATNCRQWRRALNAGDYGYVVVTLDRIQPGMRAYPREAEWTAGPQTTEVLRKRPTVIFRVNGRLPVSGCRPPAVG